MAWLVWFSSGKEKERAVSGSPHGDGATEEGSSNCLPCMEGCAYCRDDAPCHTQEDGILRVAIISFQGLCMLGDFIGMVLAYHFRRNKVCMTHLQIISEIVIHAMKMKYSTSTKIFSQIYYTLIYTHCTNLAKMSVSVWRKCKCSTTFWIYTLARCVTMVLLSLW